MLSRTTRFSLAAAATLAMCAAAYAQDGRWWRGDGDRDDGYHQAYYGQHDRDNDRYYQQGYRDGQNDARHGRSMQMRNHGHDRDDQQAYMNGYRAGYGQGNSGWRRDRDRDHDGDADDRRGGWNRNNGPYNNGPYNNGPYNNGPYNNGPYNNRGYGNYGNQAYNTGYQDGMRRGSTDRSTGHSYRPQHDDLWRNADHGYSGVMGNKQAYKDQYRNGYQAGYDRGYRSGY